MAGYLGPKAIQYNVDNSNVTNDSNVGGDLTVGGELNATNGILLGSSTDVLDDYETGTWLPTFEYRDGGTGSLTYTTQRFGSYVKVGRSVQISARLGWSANNITSPKGAFSLKGLPFASASLESERGGASIVYSDQFIENVSNVASVAFRGELSVDYMILNYAINNASNMREQLTNNSQLSSDGGFILFGYYNTNE